VKKIAFLAFLLLLMISVSLACATRKKENKATINRNTPNTITDTILNPDFQAFLKTHDSMKTAKPLDVKTSVASEESVNTSSNPTVREIGQKITEQKSNQ